MAATPERPPSVEPLHPRGFDELVTAREALATKRFDPTRLVLGLVAVMIIVVLYFAFQALTSPATHTPGGSSQTTPAPSASTSSAPSPSVSPTSSGPAVSTTAAIASGQSIDPPPGGDDNEHPELAPLAVDHDPGTSWTSRTYNKPTFGGLKPGVGYGVNLVAPALVTTVTLQVNGTGGRVEVRATDPSTPTQGPVLAEGVLSANTVLTLSTPTQTQHLVLWFTALPQTADGSNRIELAEVSVS